MLSHAFAVLFISARSAFGDIELRQEPAKAVVIQGRDLKMYADAGEFSSSPMTGGKIARVDGLRQFIWQHWMEKTRGYARLARSGKDSTQITHLFIEPDAAGAWRVALRGLNEGYPSPTSHRWFLSDTVYATSVRWIAKDPKKLMFKDPRGKKVWEL